MSELTLRETELVALGAALGSNCVPCIEHHIPQARKAGLTDDDIRAAIAQADKVRQVPARKVLETALGLLSQAGGQARGETAGAGCGCAAASQPAAETAEGGGRTIDGMAAMMAGMMARCGSHGPQ